MSRVLDVTQPREHVARVTLGRPDSMNAFNEPLLRAFVDRLSEIEAENDVRAVTVTGAGRAFCSGVDLESMPLTPEMDFAAYREGLGLFQSVVRRLRSMETPVIAAVNGYALGRVATLRSPVTFGWSARMRCSVRRSSTSVSFPGTEAPTCYRD